MKPCFRWNGETCETWENKVKDIVMRMQERDFSPLLFSFFLSLYVFFKLTREDEFLSVSFFSLSFLLSRECNVVHISRAMVIERNFCFLFFFIFFPTECVKFEWNCSSGVSLPESRPATYRLQMKQVPAPGRDEQNLTSGITNFPPTGREFSFQRRARAGNIETVCMYWCSLGCWKLRNSFHLCRSREKREREGVYNAL